MSWTQWWGYNAASVSLNSDFYGVYELCDFNGEVVYIGSGKVKSKLLGHLEKKECPLARYYRLLIVGAEEYCKLKESETLQEYIKGMGRLPLYNEKKTRFREVD